MSAKRLPGFLILALLPACRSEPPQSRSSTDSQTTVVTTASTTPDSRVATIDTSPIPVAQLIPMTGEDTGTSVQLSSARDSLCGDIGENGLRIGDAPRKAFAAQLGPADSTRSVPTPNPYNKAQTDTIMDLFYPGLRLHYWVRAVKEDERDILMEADVTNNRYLKYPTVGVGATAERIAKAMGGTADGSYTYSCALHIMSGADVSFQLEAGRVKRVTFRWELD